MTVAEFSRVPVGELVTSGEAELKTGPFGTQLKASEYTEQGTPVINVRNIGFGSIKADKLEFISPATRDRLSSHLLRSGDIVFGRKGAVERHVFIRQEQNGWFQGSDCLRLRFTSSRVEPLFASYFFLTSEHQSWMMNQCSHGATMASLNQDILERIELPLPSLHVQQRIAGILSAYDELIENSQRRIKILESMARALYREWFVHFRFPGHENHPRVDSRLGEIPKGWEIKRLDEVCRTIHDGDWIETKDQGGEDYRLLQISNVGVGEFIETGNFRYVTNETFDRLRCNEIVPGDLLVARMPTPIGRGWLVTSMPWRMITAVDVAIIRAEPTAMDQLFLVQAWNEPFNLRRIAAQASGTTRLRITRRELAAMEFVIPPISIQHKFSAFVQPQSAMIEALRQKIQNLRSTRDLLLPRLLSGQIAVDTQPISGAEQR